MKMNAYSYAMRLLSRQDYTEGKLSESLSKKNFEIGEIEEVIEALVAEGIVDDFRYAKMYVESKKKNYGRRRLEFFLREKRIKSDVIEKVLSELDEQEELEGAVETARKKERVLCGPNCDFEEGLRWKTLQKKKKKLFEALMRCGYSVEIGKKAVEIVTDDEYAGQ